MVMEFDSVTAFGLSFLRSLLTYNKIGMGKYANKTKLVNMKAKYPV